MALSAVDDSALHKMRKNGEAILCEDGYYRVPLKYWSISEKQMRTLVAFGYCRVDKVGETTIAKYISQEPK